LPTVKIKAIEKIEIRSHGAHHFALRRRSVNVFEGAMKVLMIRAPSDIGGSTGAGIEVGATGGSGVAAINASCEESQEF
jgi:hypothetical protein